MACSLPSAYYCGTSICRTDDQETGTHHNVSKLIRCPDGYAWVGYKQFKKKLAKNTNLRACERVISGSTLKCASGQLTDMVCPNKYCQHTAPESISYMNDYCTTGDRIFDDPDCKFWGGKQKYAFERVLKDKCNNVTNLQKTQCQEFCRSNPGQCPTVIDFCSIHPNDPLCSCLNSPLNDIKGEGAPPVSCFDNKCTETGYMSTNMKRISSSCPNYINCKQIIDFQDGAVLDNVKIQQQCKLEISEDRKKKQIAASSTDPLKKKQIAASSTDPLKKKPKWLRKYDKAISTGIGKKVADKINNTVPDTGLVVGGVDMDEVKPLLVLLIMIIVLVLMSMSKDLGSGAPSAYIPPRPMYY